MPLSPNGYLAAVSCVTTASCIAVGDAFDKRGKIVTLAERWNGSTWNLEPTPDTTSHEISYLTGVSCTSASFCVAVGYYQADTGQLLGFAESWSGRRWQIQTIPQPGGNTTLVGVSCPSPTACTAVGSYQTATGKELADAAQWDGTSWTLQTIPVPVDSDGTYLDAVSCSVRRACTAVGGSSTGNDLGTLADRWNGTRWSQQATPQVSGPPEQASSLSGVSCPSARWCTAVGTFITTQSSGTQLALAEQWNGKTWTKQRTIAPAATFGLLGNVACRSATSCIATGTLEIGDNGAQPSLARWGGRRWTFGAAITPHGSVGVALAGVACLTSQCTVVGADKTAAVNPLPLAEYSMGTAWRVAPVQPALGATSNTVAFDAVACGSPTSCAAVGVYENPDGRQVPLVEVRSGPVWTIEPIIEPAPARKWSAYPGVPMALNGVACPGPKHCVAVGGYLIDDDADLRPLVEIWDGTTWALQSAPKPSGATTSSFNSVSCSSADACTAVGSYKSGTDRWPFAERWNGTAWTNQTVTKTTATTGADFSSVSCPTATSCTAVGYGLVSEHYVPLAAHWDGTAWTVQQAPEPTGATNATEATLVSVSCPSPDYCVAVGSANYDTVVAEVWEGAGWTAQSISTLGRDSFVSAVSCPSDKDCTAVGSISDHSLAVRWDGTSWTVDNPSDPRGTGFAGLAGVACTAPASCTAVGSSSLSYQPDVTEPLADVYG